MERLNKENSTETVGARDDIFMPVYLGTEVQQHAFSRIFQPLTSGNVAMKNEPLRIEPANSKTLTHAMPLSLNVVSFK